jgi:hypothetical protein
MFWDDSLRGCRTQNCMWHFKNSKRTGCRKTIPETQGPWGQEGALCWSSALLSVELISHPKQHQCQLFTEQDTELVGGGHRWWDTCKNFKFLEKPRIRYKGRDSARPGKVAKGPLSLDWKETPGVLGMESRASHILGKHSRTCPLGLYSDFLVFCFGGPGVWT